MKMKKLTSLCGCLLLSMCMGVGAMTAPLSAEAAAREKVILDADMVDLFDDGIAMMMLAESPKMDLKGVTIVIGNTEFTAISGCSVIKNEFSRVYNLKFAQVSSIEIRFCCH